MWKMLPFLIIVLDIWIIFMQLKWEWFTDSKKEGLTSNTQEKLDALQKELFMIEALVGQNTTLLQECKAIVGAKFDAIKKEKAELCKRNYSQPVMGKLLKHLGRALCRLRPCFLSQFNSLILFFKQFQAAPQ